MTRTIIRDGLHALAREIEYSGTQEMNIILFKEIIIRANLGIDKRTHKNWFRAAMAMGLIQRAKREGKYVKNVFCRGPRFGEFLNNNQGAK